MMQNTPPDTTSNEAIVDWFAAAGLTVEVIEDHAEALDQAA